LQLRESKASILQHNALHHEQRRLKKKQRRMASEARYAFQRELLDLSDEDLSDEEKDVSDSKLIVNEKKDEEWNFTQAAAYCSFLTSRLALNPYICALIQIMLVQPPSVADCERLFSTMSLIKNAKRNRLSNPKLNALLMINKNNNFIKMSEVVNSWINQERKRKAKLAKR
jgi:hypothetical protein